jgi:hypothetical protein
LNLSVAALVGKSKEARKTGDISGDTNEHDKLKFENDFILFKLILRKIFVSLILIIFIYKKSHS